MAGILKDCRRWNGSLWLPVLLLAFLAVAGSANAALRIGSTLPPVTLSGIDGAPVRIPESLKGKVVILHFWQIGCSSCKLEMPAMDGLYGKYRRKGLEVLAVNVGQKKETVKAFAAELGVSYPLLIDPDEKSATIIRCDGCAQNLRDRPQRRRPIQNSRRRHPGNAEKTDSQSSLTE